MFGFALREHRCSTLMADIVDDVTEANIIFDAVQKIRESVVQQMGHLGSHDKLNISRRFPPASTVRRSRWWSTLGGRS